jgi:uncharacterized membrane protein
MRVLSRPRVIWFLCLAALALINMFFGGLMGDYPRDMTFIALIIIAAVSLLVLLVSDHRTADRRSLSEHAKDVDRAMEAEEKYKQ